MLDVDIVLLPLLNSTDEEERQQMLEDLVLVHAAPVIRQVLRQRLGFYVSRLGTNPDSPDAEDVYSEAIKQVVEWLRGLQEKTTASQIKRFDQYVRRIALNVCHNYLRSKAPQRYRLKSNLRYLLDSHREFTVWKTGNNTTLCGFANWRQKKSSALFRLDEEQMGWLAEQGQAHFVGQHLLDVPLDRLVAEVFTLLNRPIELNVLVEAIATLQGTKDQPAESLDETDSGLAEQLVDSRPRLDEQLEQYEKLGEIWEELLQLPQNHRLAICLRFEDENADDLWSMLVGAGIITPAELAEQFGLTLNELVALWGQIPMSNADIAAHLGVRKQQVSQWRSRGWDKLNHLIGDKTKI